MAVNAAERQKQRHRKMLEKGLKKRAFYVNQETLGNLAKYKNEHKLESLDEALNQIIKAVT